VDPFESGLLAGLGGLAAGKIVLAAVSGGADSSAMLAGLAAIREEAGITLRCAHVEHGIRPAAESRGDATAVEAFCEKLDIPCKAISIRPGKIAALAGNGGPGLEATARVFRYRALSREARRTGADRILTAHTRDDLLETLLMRVLRGAGPAGLAPMPRIRGRVLRPMLGLSRRDVLAYLEGKDIPYRIDSTNDDIRYLRNKVRHKLVPLLDNSFPSWRGPLLALAETQSLVAEFLGSEARRRLPWNSDEAGILSLNEEDFLKAPLILREEAVFAGADMLAARGGGRKSLKPSAVPKRSAVRLAAGPGAGLPAARPADLGPVRLERREGFIRMIPAIRGRGERGFSLLIKEAGFYTLKGKVIGKSGAGGLCIKARAVPVNQSPPAAGVKGFHAALPLVFRNYREGDRVLWRGHRRGFSAIIKKETCSEYDGIITACDPSGTAAFIGMGRGGLVVTGREGAGETHPPTRAGEIYFIELSVME
jgi:tRNA(Ile)-lysidine synthase